KGENKNPRYNSDYATTDIIRRISVSDCQISIYKFNRRMRILMGISALMIGMIVNAQNVLTVSGKVYTDNTNDWSGVNISRSVPTKLIFTNNSITSVNTFGYLLQAGDELPGAYNNNLDGEIITGNKLIWNGTDMTSITHGI